MNSFANTLFTLLFGWLRSLVQGVWNAVVQGDFSQFFVWLGDHWIPVLVGLCILCTVLDYLVWFIRWRPYLVWRTKFRRLLRRVQGKEWQEEKQFDQGYQEGVALEMPLEPAQLAPQDMSYELQRPVVFVETMGEEKTQYFHGEESQNPAEYSPPYTVSAPPYERYFAPGQEIPNRGTERRRRRSQKNERKMSPWERFAAAREAEEGMLDGLPPAVNRQQAFHEPVYPDRPQQSYPAWQRPKNPTDGTEA